MRFRDPAPRRDRIAIAGSIALHCCVLALLAVALPRVAAVPVEDPDERSLLATPIRIERRAIAPPHLRVVPRRVAATAPAPPRARPRPLVVAAAPARARRALVVPAEHRYRTPTRPAARRRTPQIVAAAAVETAAPRPERSAPAALPSAAPTPRATEAAIAGEPASAPGIGNFGESYEARPMPGMLDTVRAKVALHAVVRIALDEHGRAVAVTVVSGVDDPAQRDALIRTLQSAAYIPARCNGLDCDATLTLRL